MPHLRSNSEIPSLIDLSLSSLLSPLQLSPLLHLLSPSFPYPPPTSVRKKILLRIKECVNVLRETYDETSLRDALDGLNVLDGEIVYNAEDKGDYFFNFIKEIDDREKEVSDWKNYTRSGKVIGNVLTPSFKNPPKGNEAIPYSDLVRGWEPIPHVDWSRREYRLDDTEFVRVFGIGKEEWKKVGKEGRRRAKERVGLF